MMGSLSIWHWLILAVVAALLFGGKGKLSSIMGDAAKGIKAFKEGLKGEEHEASPAAIVPTGVITSDAAVREAAAREATAREVLARETAAREAAEIRARENAAR